MNLPKIIHRESVGLNQCWIRQNRKGDFDIFYLGGFSSEANLIGTSESLEEAKEIIRKRWERNVK